MPAIHICDADEDPLCTSRVLNFCLDSESILSSRSRSLCGSAESSVGSSYDTHSVPTMLEQVAQRLTPIINPNDQDIQNSWGENWLDEGLSEMNNKTTELSLRNCDASVRKSQQLTNNNNENQNNIKNGISSMHSTPKSVKLKDMPNSGNIRRCSSEGGCENISKLCDDRKGCPHPSGQLEKEIENVLRANGNKKATRPNSLEPMVVKLDSGLRDTGRKSTETHQIKGPNSTTPIGRECGNSPDRKSRMSNRHYLSSNNGDKDRTERLLTEAQFTQQESSQRKPRQLRVTDKRKYCDFEVERINENGRLVIYFRGGRPRSLSPGCRLCPPGVRTRSLSSDPVPSYDMQALPLRLSKTPDTG